MQQTATTCPARPRDTVAVLRHLIRGGSLSRDEARTVAREIMDGAVPAARIAALLVALRMKGETLDEIEGFVRAMRERAETTPFDGDDVIDTCGTGGDGAGTFNISTAVAFVAAGAGCRVAKHGNRAVSSASGSSDVLAALGVATELTPADAGRCLDETGLCFLFAPRYHPAARHAAEPRRDIGIRSIFNVVGPLTHPAGARRQLMGVFDGALTEPLARVLGRLGSKRAMVVHGDDGLDELSLCGPSRVSDLRDGEVRSYTVAPETLGLSRCRPEDLAGGDPRRNAEILEAVFDGAPGPRRDVVLLNAAAAIHVAGRAADLEEGLSAARRSLDAGRARECLARLRRLSRELADG